MKVQIPLAEFRDFNIFGYLSRNLLLSHGSKQFFGDAPPTIFRELSRYPVDSPDTSKLGFMSAVKATYIAGSKTNVDWYVLRSRLLRPEAGAWSEAFTEYFEVRLNLRYLNPIKTLQVHDASQGEGFSILAIQCSLVEFLESTVQGKNYRYLPRGQTPGPYEYSASQEIFVSFLRNRAPFANTFDEESARDFYVGVRCGLLHEARTKNGWRIRAQGVNGVLANVKDRIVYRNNFHSALIEFIKSYGTKLQTEPLLQEAFIRKFDDLCV